MSKENLKDKYAELKDRQIHLEKEWEEVKAIFETLSNLYEESKGGFSTGRYGKLKDMIKSATSEENLQRIRQATQDTKSGGGGVAGLLNRAKELSSAGEAQQQQTNQAAKEGKSNKMSGFFKKLKNITGLSDEPIRDEDVMTDSELQRDNGRRQRVIQRHIIQFTKALTVLEKLKKDYEASKSKAPPRRYQELKDMIKATVAEKL